MSKDGIRLKYLPDLNDPLFIAGFDGWGNALDISRGMVDYLIRKSKAMPFGRIDPDMYYRFDDKRPDVTIADGLIENIDPPGGTLYRSARNSVGRDIIILNASEPSLQWYHFTDDLLSLCRETGVKTIITLGSMYDNVLHTDHVISALASNSEILSALKAKNVTRVNYKGPGGIHSTIHSEAQKMGFDCVSFWCHCPYYLQGTTHFGLLSRLGSLLAEWGGFTLDTEELSIAWKDLNKQIQAIIDKNPELQDMIHDIRKTKVRGAWDLVKRHNNIIQIEDFIKPKQ